jgi:hypothetical protein
LALRDTLRGIDPLISLAPICLGLSACFIALLVELEKERALAPPSPVVSDRRRRDRRNQGVDS